MINVVVYDCDDDDNDEMIKFNLNNWSEDMFGF